MTDKTRTLVVLAALTAVSVLVASCGGGTGGPSAGHAPGSEVTHRRALPPGFTLSNGRQLPAPVGVLVVEEVDRLNVADLHTAPLPPDQLRGIAQSVVNSPAQVAVRPLLVSQGTLHAGGQVVVAAARLGVSGPHDALFVLQGPSIRLQRLVQIKSGVAVAKLLLPSDMEHGTWALAVEDDSGISVIPGKKPTGTILLDLAIFSV